MDVGAINIMLLGLTYFSKNENQKLKSELNFFFLILISALEIRI